MSFLIIGLSFSAFAGTRRSSAGNRGVGTRLTQPQGKSTFSRNELTVLCGRYFDECSRSYKAKKRKFKDPKCQDLMPQCFKALGPNSTQCQDKVYSCLDKICQPRSQCENEQRVKEIAISCLEQSGKYYPYTCSPRLFQSVVSQILTEATGIPTPPPSQPQTNRQNQVSPEMQAQLDAQAQQLAQQQALLTQQQQALAQAEAEKKAKPTSEPKEEKKGIWEDHDECDLLRKKSERVVEDATYYAKCSPDIGEVEEKDESIGGFGNLDWSGIGGGDYFGGGGMMETEQPERDSNGIIYVDEKGKVVKKDKAIKEYCYVYKKNKKGKDDKDNPNNCKDVSTKTNPNWNVKEDSEREQTNRFKTNWKKVMVESCSEKPARLKSLRYKGNTALKELKNFRACSYKLYKKARNEEKDGDYLLMLQKKLGAINNGIGKVGSTISRLDINNFMKDVKNTEKYVFKNPNTDLNNIKHTVYSSMKNLKILSEMNRIVLVDISNLYSGIELDRGDDGATACQGLPVEALDVCVSKTAEKYLNQIRKKKGDPTPSFAEKVKDLYNNSSYNLVDCNLDKYIETTTLIKACLRALKSQANEYKRKVESKR